MQIALDVAVFVSNSSRVCLMSIAYGQRACALLLYGCQCSKFNEPWTVNVNRNYIYDICIQHTHIQHIHLTCSMPGGTFTSPVCVDRRSQSPSPFKWGCSILPAGLSSPKSKPVQYITQNTAVLLFALALCGLWFNSGGVIAVLLIAQNTQQLYMPISGQTDRHCNHRYSGHDGVKRLRHLHLLNLPKPNENA